MHVVQIAEAFGGGVARQLAQLAVVLPPLGWRTTFLVGARPDEPTRHARHTLESAGAVVETLPRLGRSPWHPCRDRAALADLRARLRRLAPDLVHTHAAKGGYLGRRAARDLGIPALHTPHVFAFEWASWPFSTLYTLLERRAAGRGDALVCLTEAQRADARDRGIPPRPEDAVVLPNGVDLRYFRPPAPAERQAARAALDLPPDRPDLRVAGYMGRFSHQKNLPALLRAARLHAVRHPDFRLRLAGRGPDVPDDPKSADWLRCGGESDDPRAFYWALDVMVLPSRWEGLPYALLEALACGVPVVATATRGARALITEGVEGWLSPTSDPTALASALERWRRSIDLQGTEIFAAAARQRAENHDLDDWARRLTALYGRIARRQAPDLISE